MGAPGESQKYEFGSPQWLACIHGIMAARATDAVKELDGADYSMCEVFTGVPTAVHPEGRAAWHCRIKDGTFMWSLGEVDDVQRKVVCDWETILPLGRTVFADDPEAAARTQKDMAAAVAEGKISVTGGFAGAPTAFAGVHDDIARLTK